jgi:hypothetical protein
MARRKTRRKAVEELATEFATDPEKVARYRLALENAKQKILELHQATEEIAAYVSCQDQYATDGWRWRLQAMRLEVLKLQQELEEEAEPVRRALSMAAIN